VQVAPSRVSGRSGRREPQPRANAALGRAVEGDGPAVQLRQVADDRQAQARAGRGFVGRTPRCSTVSCSEGLRPGPSSSTRIRTPDSPIPSAKAVSRTRDRDHLQALSSRLPSISSRSSGSTLVGGGRLSRGRARASAPDGELRARRGSRKTARPCASTQRSGHCDATQQGSSRTRAILLSAMARSDYAWSSRIGFRLPRMCPLALVVFSCLPLSSCGSGGGGPTSPSRSLAPMPSATPLPPPQAVDAVTGASIEAVITPEQPGRNERATIRAAGYLVREQLYTGEPIRLWPARNEALVRQLVYIQGARGTEIRMRRWEGPGFALRLPPEISDVPHARAALERARRTGLGRNRPQHRDRRLRLGASGHRPDGIPQPAAQLRRRANMAAGRCHHPGRDRVSRRRDGSGARLPAATASQSRPTSWATCWDCSTWTTTRRS